MPVNHQLVLRSRPEGLPVAANFALTATEVPHVLEDGEVLIRHEWLGLAPAARVRMSGEASYAPPTAIGEVVYGQAVGTVVVSRNPHFAPGDAAFNVLGGWQEYSVAREPALAKVDTALAPMPVWLGALGTSGLTAYVGLTKVAGVRRDETVVVSAASGAVGSLAGQIARLEGCRVVGIAGGAEKCSTAVEEYGFDACIDYKDAGFSRNLAAALPAGANVYFENVGGRVRESVWPLMALEGRVAVCGLISEYNGEKQAGPDWFSLLVKRLTVKGFIVGDYLGMREEFVEKMAGWHASGKVRLREDVTNGLEHTPEAFIGMLAGRNRGKTLVRL